jgi:hypothetical protein
MKLLSLCVLFGSASVALARVSKDGNCGGTKGQTCLQSGELIFELYLVASTEIPQCLEIVAHSMDTGKKVLL